MPSFVHEHAIRLLEQHPAVLRELCSWVDIEQPGPQVHLQPEHPELRVDVGVQGDVRQLRPDLFVREWNKAIQRKPGELESIYEPPAPDLAGADTTPASLTALWLVDVQASQDETRPDAWIVYVINIAYFFKIEPAFLILALGKSMESWCREQVQAHKRLRAEENVWILGPSMLAGKNPANPHVAAIMAVIYRRDAPLELVKYAVKGLLATGKPEDVGYARMVILAVHPDVAKEAKEQAMQELNMQQWEVGEIERESYPFLEGREEGLKEGLKEGITLALLAVLRARGLDVSERLKDALADCRDLAVLEQLANRATQFAGDDELLAELSKLSAARG